MSEVGVVDGTWLRRERAELLALLGRLDESDWRRPTECPAWNVHQVALHILGDDVSLLSRQRDAAPNGLFLFAAGRPASTFRELLDGFNEQWATATSFLSSRVTIDLLERSGEWTATFYEDVDPHALGEPVGFFGATGPSPYWQIISREFGERWIHQQQIRRATEADDLDAEHLAVVAGIVVRAIGIRLGDLGLGTGTSFAVAIDGVARWTLHATAAGGWDVRADPDGDAPSDVPATLSIGAAQAIRLFSRAPAGADDRPSFRRDGDPVVTGAVLRALVPLFA